MAILPFDDPASARFVVFLTESELKDSWRLLQGRESLTHGRAGVALLEVLDATRPVGKLLRFLRLYWVVGAIDYAIKLARPLLTRVVPKVEPVRRPPD